MSGYLQRLISRPAAAHHRGLRPFVRSGSPIAARDQRIGLPGFEAGGFGDSEIAEPPGIPELARSPSLHDTLKDLHQSADRHAARKWTPSISQADSGTGAGRPAVLKGSYVNESNDPDSPSKDLAPETRRQNSRAVELGDDARDRGATIDSQHKHLSPSAPALEQPPVTEVFPASVTRAFANDDYSELTVPNAIDQATPDDVERPAAPRVEIGSIQVQVTSEEPAAQKGSAKVPSRPANAESVSLIGPLAARRRSNLRFAVRQR